MRFAAGEARGSGSLFLLEFALFLHSFVLNPGTVHLIFSPANLLIDRFLRKGLYLKDVIQSANPWITTRGANPPTPEGGGGPQNPITPQRNIPIRHSRGRHPLRGF